MYLINQMLRDRCKCNDKNGSKVGALDNGYAVLALLQHLIVEMLTSLEKLGIAL